MSADRTDACIARLNAELAASNEENVEVIKRAGRLMNEKERLEEKVAKIEEQYTCLLEQTIGLMGNKVKHLKGAEKMLIPKPQKRLVVVHTCKRAMCIDFMTGTCHKRICNRAHEEDTEHYRNIVHAGHVQKVKNKNKQTKKRAMRR
ncbi:hypothetical protein PTNB73_04776 [Pyrenophora teres f. teres]|nr:hypothetical protein HRS9139_05663 [Pyrenophora teres f. teres]KAE8840384.1 hypothetical protein PTNB85_03783 [Pyrenophora teres f. teres]KAE8849475.1 hypothetical protein HRS9122_03491 [Pyrenophora teres f. teres]KAE8863883.1 hypothetical protein PTNB29_03847 [Pyrenophora teres f. teres]KAE8866682.1 hypothetical protein PTNB73_04776 [Pyrenophora teres f. teres]